MVGDPYTAPYQSPVTSTAPSQAAWLSLLMARALVLSQKAFATNRDSRREDRDAALGRHCNRLTITVARLFARFISPVTPTSSTVKENLAPPAGTKAERNLS
jgi:hypothetical protein